MSARPAVFSVVAALVFGLTISFALAAEMQILESNLPDRYSVGSKIPESNSLHLPPCGRVKVLLSNGASKEFKGPSSGCTTNEPVGGTRNGPTLIAPGTRSVPDRMRPGN